MKPINRILFTLALFAGGLAFGATQTVDGIAWTYTVSNGTASVGTGQPKSSAIPKSTAGKITIPSTLGGCPVRDIDEFAFYGCKSLKSVTIPPGVTAIGGRAFSECRALKSVTIPPGVTNIGAFAFVECCALKSVTIPVGVKAIEWMTFAKCSRLTSVTIPPGVTNIGAFVFQDCAALTSVTLPSSVSHIGSCVFYGCCALTEISIEPGGTAYYSVGGVLFNRDQTELIVYPAARKGPYVIPSGVTVIGERAFCDCEFLTSVRAPASVTTIGKHAFLLCHGLKSLEFLGLPPEGLEGAGIYRRTKVIYPSAHAAEWTPAITASGIKAAIAR